MTPADPQAWQAAQDRLARLADRLASQTRQLLAGLHSSWRRSLQLRVATSGRVTCFAPGDMGSMSGSHAAGTMSPGAANPHAGGSKPPNK